MKTMTCRDLVGACDKELHANTCEEMAAKSKQHGREMFEQGDEAHLQAINKMQERMSSPEMMNAWFEGKKRNLKRCLRINNSGKKLRGKLPLVLAMFSY